MEPHKYILLCTNCNPSAWVEIDKDDPSLTIILDLETDEWKFKANCPWCHNKIYIIRKAF